MWHPRCGDAGRVVVVGVVVGNVWCVKGNQPRQVVVQGVCVQGRKGPSQVAGMVGKGRWQVVAGRTQQRKKGRAIQLQVGGRQAVVWCVGEGYLRVGWEVRSSPCPSSPPGPCLWA